MKLRIHSGEIGKAVKSLTKVASRHELAHYNNIEVHASPDSLTLRAGDGTIFASVYIPLDVTTAAGDETVLVDARMLDRVLSQARSDVMIQTTEKAMTVTTSWSGRTRLPLVLDKLPDVKPVSGTPVAVPAEKFFRCYGHVMHALADENEPRKQNLSGTLVESDGSELHMTALDGFRLGMNAVPVAGGASVRALIPGRLMKLADDMLAGEEIRFVTDGGRISMTDGRTVLTGVLLSGDFPDFKKLIPVAFGTEIRMGRDALLNVLANCNVVAAGNEIPVRINVGTDSITVSSISEAADFNAEVLCDVRGEQLQLSFNIRYLLDALYALEGEHIVIGMNSQTAPVVLTDADTDSNLQLVMPVRTM